MAISTDEWLQLFPAKYREALRAEIYGCVRADGFKRTECTRKEAVARVLHDLLLDPAIKARLEEAARVALAGGHPMLWSIIRGMIQEVPPLKKARVWFKDPAAAAMLRAAPTLQSAQRPAVPTNPPSAQTIIELATRQAPENPAEPA